MKHWEKMALATAGLIVFAYIAVTFGYNLAKNENSETQGQASLLTDKKTTTQEKQKPNIELTIPKGSCTDVTTYDYNWENDMLCTRPDGSKFYTDYAGANKYEGSFD